MEVATQVQDQKIDPEAISKTPDGTTATISRARKVEVFCEAARERIEAQAKKLPLKSSKNLHSDKMLE